MLLFIFYAHLNCFTVSWHILCRLVLFTAFWDCCGHFVYFYPFWYVWTKKNLATLFCRMQLVSVPIKDRCFKRLAMD
jgi:hypothetical protein